MMYRLIAIVIFLTSCNSRDVVVEKDTRDKCDTLYLAREFIPVHDTLVIILTRDSIKRPPFDSTKIQSLFSGWEQGPIEPFKDGRTKDTIQKHEIIYY